jgi:hypothetical protein
MRNETRGFCKYCGKEFTRSGMMRHLFTCKRRMAVLEAEEGKRKACYYLLLISAKYNSDYWLVVEIREDALLKDLDQFIRNIWVECCGHLSAFQIGGVMYESHSEGGNIWGPPSKSMGCKVGEIFSDGMAISYEYDFGSTTELVIKVQDHRFGVWQKEPVVILSRNNPPEIVCGHCGTNSARWVDPERIYEEDPYWCDECLLAERREEAAKEDGEEYDEEGEWDEEMAETEFFLPVCNSPRMGVCGYEGSETYPDQFQPDVI